ncbi:MAG: hypothetical protein O7D96_05165, partial [SAR324 cluster bacterium]|nr:hypothetical protein [SAR324 cluster bacterium]
ALLRGFLRDAAAPAGCSALAAIWWEPHLRRVELGPRLSTAADHFSPAALAVSAELPVRAAEALERQQATVLRAERTEPAPDWEQAILLSLGAAQGVWLPLVNAGESFGAVLVAPGTPGADFDPEAQGTLQRALRVIAPALRRARVAELVQAEEASLRDSVSDLERRLGHARGLTPRAFRGLLEAHDGEPPAESLEVDGALVLSGQIRGLAVLSRQGHGRVRLALESYYRQVDEALALHHGHLEQTDQGGWIARFERGADSVLWAALTATQLLMAWQLQPNGDSDLATGFGIHTGRWVEAWIRTEHRIAPLALGPAAEVSSRLAELTFRYRTRILVSQAVVDGLAEPQRFELRPLGTLRLPQGGGRIGYHELYGTREAPERERMTERQSLWQAALQHYRRGEWRDAASGFRAYLADLPNDRPAKLYLRQCRRHLA